MKKFSSNQQKGFTLVEMLVASLIFSIIVLAVSEIFVTVLTNQRRAFAAQQIEESGQFAMELMAREIRVSDITDQDSTDCSATTLTIDHPVNGTVVYSLNSGVLQRTADGVTTDISSSEVKFSRLNFCVAGSGPTDQEQARVAILAAVQNKSGRDTLTF
ncbi:MAG TPA: prepilin-type N-terminal cleavage/methylation domain-containing protein, partial [Candidatus Paceibacterota bacterium]|nr:prepilin-type N-terminal cleavage/methylation domain-containing protein [Candidatus Paceibacterota bacterium]